MQTHAIQPQALLRSVLLARPGQRLVVLGVSAAAAGVAVLVPYSQKRFVDEILAGLLATPWVWAAFGLTLVAQGLSQLSLWLAVKESLVTQKALADAAYARLLEGPGGLIGRRPAGEAVSLFAVDVPGAAAMFDQVLVMAGSMLFPLLVAPLALALLGIPLWSSLLVLAVLCLIHGFLARRQSAFFIRFKNLAAERTGRVAEWVQNMRTLRILGWMRYAEARILDVRTRETRNRKGMVTNGQVMNSISMASTYLLNIGAVAFLLRSRGPEGAPTAGELLSLLWIIGVYLQRPLRQFPWVLVIGMDSLTSLRRLREAFAVPVVQPLVNAPGAGPRVDPAAGGRAPVLEVRALRLESDGQVLLKDIDLSLRVGELVAVVGEVGSGKSLLLQSLLGATGAEFARYALDGEPTAGPVDPAVRSRFAYVPQEGFTMSATLRENVRLEYLDLGDPLPGDGSEELRSLKLAQFDPSEERIPSGLEAEIGERGVNLSGGQKQRISMARADFAGRSLLLLDDCLSAVDVDTEKRLVDELVCGEWAGSARLLVTHRMSILPRCDRVIFMEDGAVAMQGRFEQLLERSEKFRDFVRREAVKPYV
ncbi:MAG: ABC transporter ATP-binding protein/permease [Bdellovibrionales bacterium]|nr:ABC transporter ATP-binding protein/permease [Bdellovibrionales bacterium]